MNNLRVISFLILICISIFSGNIPVHASGSIFVMDGKAVVYKKPLSYRYDLGSLGKFSNSQAVDLIEDLLGDWEAVPTSTITFERDNPGSLTVDITSQNFGTIFNIDTFLGYTPIVFDNDGSIFDALFGSGSSNQILGVASPVTTESGDLSDEIVESQAIFNGKFINGIDTVSDPENETDSFKGTVIHEFGHAFGLDHSQINTEAIQGTSTQTIRDSVPLMFPIAVNNLFRINRDDQSSAALLNPENSQLQSFGTIEGKVFRSDGTTPIQGANVIARKTDDTLNEAVSCVSDFLLQNTGFYKLVGLTPGDYKIEIEPIESSFTGGSAVGPFSKDSSDKSFQNPVTPGYFTGAGMTITTDINQATIVMVSAGQTLTNQNIVSTTQGSSSSSSGSTSGGTINETEPNNSIAEAQVITVPVIVNGNAATGDAGELTLGSDTGDSLTISDLFKFTINQTTDLTISLDINSSATSDDLDLALFDEEANEIIESSSLTGNANESISRTLSPGTYLVGLGAFSGSTSYTLSLNTASNGGEPFLTITGPTSIVLNQDGNNNQAVIQVQATNFTSKSNCIATAEGDTFVKVKPKKFKLSSTKTSKSIKIKIPQEESLGLINSNQSAKITVETQCSNGAFDEFEFDVLPNAGAVSGTRKNFKQIKK